MIKRNFTIAIITLTLVIGSILVANNIDLLPETASLNAPIYDELFKVLFIIGLILFLGIFGLIIFSLIKFRRRPGQYGDGIDLEGNITLEIFWTVIPSIIILFIGLYSYDIYDRMGGMQSLSHDHHMSNGSEKIWAGISPSNSTINNSISQLPIEVTALQFAFLFDYPEGDITTGELHVPINREIVLRMQSKDVIHAFWVPAFRIKQDIIPGQPTVLSFTPTKLGTYSIICAELCGPYHGGMRASVVVQEPKEYEKWFENNKKVDL